MERQKKEVSIRGKTESVEAFDIDGKVIVVTGRTLKVASVKDEVCDSGISEPKLVIEELRQRGHKVDIFTFDQKLPDVDPRFDYYFEWDNHAAVEIQSFEHWWNKQIGNDARRMVRKAQKLGVVVKSVPFSDELVKGIKDIYDEMPIRRGKPFWHYNKSLAEIEADNASFLERSEFIGAYVNEELIGFDRIIYTDCRGAQIQLIAKLQHKDKCPINALLAKAVEICAARGIRFLTYGSYVYGKKGADALTKFKERNGFSRYDYPRYYVPLTLRGEVALKLGVHKSLIDILPSSVVDVLLAIRSKYYESTRLWDTKISPLEPRAD